MLVNNLASTKTGSKWRKDRTLTSGAEFGKIRKQIVDSFKSQLRGLMGYEAGFLNGPGRDRVRFYYVTADRFRRLPPPWLGGWAARLPPAGHASSRLYLSWITAHSGRVHHDYQPSKGAYQYVVESADSASKLPQLESKRERGSLGEKERERERALCFAMDDRLSMGW